MSSPMTMNRVIQAAVRRDLARLESALDAAPDVELEPLMLPHLESPDWKAVEKSLRPESLADSGRWMAWIQHGMPDGSTREAG